MREIIGIIGVLSGAVSVAFVCGVVLWAARDMVRKKEWISLIGFVSLVVFVTCALILGNME